MTRHKIIIDTDAGYDDALAFFLLSADPAIEICAVTTVAGNFSVDVVTRNIFSFMHMSGTEKIPVHCGADRPLSRDLVMSHEGITMDGLSTACPQDGLASEKIIDLARNHQGNITVLAIGPLTNIAQAIMQDPQLPSLLRQIVIMGGAIDARGISQSAEYNVFVDPEAADIVLHAPVKKIMVPLDLCRKTTVPLDSFQALPGEAVKNLLLPMMTPFCEGPEQNIMLCDAIAAFYLLHPAHFTTQDAHITVETEDEAMRGKTIVREGQKPNVSIAADMDEDLFMTALTTALRRIR